MQAFCSLVASTLLLVVTLSLVPPIPAAPLVMEPVFNRVAGSGPADNNFPLHNPDFLIGGIAYFTADEPGEIITYASGDPRDPVLDVVHVWNNTEYNLTGFTLRIIGTATDSREPATIVRGPVDAIWGDVDGDGRIGVSDIFSTVVVSADGREIRFSGGVIPIGGRFTDIHLARSDNQPSFAGIDSSFAGEPVPESSTWLLVGGGLGLFGWWKRRH